MKYFESLEKRIAGYETRIAGLEALVTTQKTTIENLEAKVKELQDRPLPEPQVVEKIVEKIVEVEKPAAEPAPEIPETDEVVEEPVKPEVQETPVEEPVTVEPVKEEPEVVEKAEAPEIQEAPVVEMKQPEPKPEPELFVDEPASSKAVLYGKPVDDIRQAISLGDRFLYQRELFGQNAELMQKTLTDLNALHSFDEAVSYIMTHFQWDKESSTYQQFLVTLHRRFG